MTPLNDTLIAVERAALDRWGKGDPKGYLEIFDREITYFDPMQTSRLDGIDAMNELLIPLTGKIRVDRYDMIAPNVQHSGDVAVLSYRLVSHLTGANGEPLAVRWNSTAVYQRFDGEWRMIHSHWSYTTPELKQPVSEVSQ